MTDQDTVLYDVQDSIARITLNRPEASNGVSLDLLKRLYEVIMQCHGDRRVRAVILSGNGPNFCAGGDVKEFAAKGEALPDFLRMATSYLQVSSGALARLEAPVITKVQGFAAGGGGMGLVCASDIVIAGQSAKFMTGATRVGMAPDGGASVTLPRLIGFRAATELLLTNRIVEADEAKAIGLITAVAPDEDLDATVQSMAERIAAGAPLANAATKRLLWDGLGRSLEDCLPAESQIVSALSGTADAREGLAAVIERRKPVFTGK